MRRTDWTQIFGWIILMLAVGATWADRLPVRGEGAHRRAASESGLDPALEKGEKGQVRVRALRAYANLPLRFEENRGQLGEHAREVAYFARAGSYDLFLTAADLVLRFPVEQGEARAGKADRSPSEPVLRMAFRGGQRSTLRGEERLPGESHYLMGSDPAAWRREIPAYRRVRASSVYPGIDVLYYGEEGNGKALEYDLVVAPGAVPSSIRIAFSGGGPLTIDPDGAMSLPLGGRSIRFSAPVAYQEASSPSGVVDKGRRQIPCRFRLLGPDEVGFEVGLYDPSRPLVIDPVVEYATFLGGGGREAILDLALDAFGGTYLTGWTSSPDFPIQPTAPSVRQPVSESGAAFIVKLDPTGTSLAYSTYLGSQGSRGVSLAVDLLGAAYVAGNTRDERFPTTPGAFQVRPQGPAEWPFVLKLDYRGVDLQYSTFLTGLEGAQVAGIAADRFGSAFVTGLARAGFPTTPGAVQAEYRGGLGDAFVAQLDAQGSRLIYATYLGGADLDQGRAITVDPAGNAYVTGTTTRSVVFSMQQVGAADSVLTSNFASTAGFPVTPGAVQAVLRGRSDLFVTGIRPGGGDFLYSTLLGGSGQETIPADESFSGRTIAVDALGQVHLTGTTTSLDFPTTPAAYRRELSGESDVMLVKFQADGSRLLYSTLLGGNQRESGRALALDSEGNAYVTGWTSSPDFPVTGDQLVPAPLPTTPQPAAFLTQVDVTGSRVLSSTLLGGSGADQAFGLAVDRFGHAYLAGATTSANFPIVRPGFQQSLQGSQDGFVVKLQPGGGGMAVNSIHPTVGGDGGTVTVLLHGQQLRDGASVRLTRQGEAPLIARHVYAGADGRTLGAVFDLRGRPRGAWSVLVVNPDGATSQLRDGFRVEPAREATMLVDQPWGPHAIRTGQRQLYTIGYRHTGNNDLYGVPIWVKVRGTATLRVVTTLALPGDVPGEPALNWPEVVPSMGTFDGGATAAFLPAVVAPERTGYVMVEVTGPQQSSSILTLEAWAYPPSIASLGSPEDPTATVAECYLAVAKLTAQQAGTPAHERCDSRAREVWRSLLATAVRETHRTPDRPGKVLSLSQVTQAVAMSAMRCMGAIPTLSQVSNAASRVLGARDEMRICFDRKVSPVFRLLTSVRSFDQNDLRGTVGVGPSQYLPGGRALHYAVYFENLPTSGLPVREVVITSQLDLAAIDPKTFQFGAISVGAHLEVPPVGLHHYTREFDLRPARA
ncbi:MAG: SBBP repeat-containing protein, partial [Blastocatellia bacterium]